MRDKRLWGVKCELSFCESTKRKFPSMKFFQFPIKDSELFDRWINILGLQTPPKTKKAYLCEKHFSPDCFNERKRRNVTPSLFLSPLPIEDMNIGLHPVENLNTVDLNTNLAVTSNDSFPAVIFSGKTYLKKSANTINDLTLEEFSKLDPYYSKQEEIIERFCNSCEKFQKSVQFYRKRYLILLKKYNHLKSKTSRFSKQISFYKFRTKNKKILEKPKPITVHCFKGLFQTIHAILGYSETIFEKYPEISFILTNKLNQDCLENLFGLIRARGGLNHNPSVYEFGKILQKIIANKILFHIPSSSNCLQDIENNKLVEIENDNKLNQKVSVGPKFSPSSINNHPESGIDTFEEEYDGCNDAENYKHSIEGPSLRYFLGFVLFRLLPKVQCERCKNDLQKVGEDIQLSDPSELFIFHKNYSKQSDFGKLVPPTDVFYEVSKYHVSIFKKI